MDHDHRYGRLVEDIKRHGWRDICEICYHVKEVEAADCDLECESCELPCTCHGCRNCNRWEWRGEHDG